MNVLVKDWMKQKKQKGLKPRKKIYIYIHIYIYIYICIYISLLKLKSENIHSILILVNKSVLNQYCNIG